MKVVAFSAIASIEPGTSPDVLEIPVLLTG
jgi:hypothetical protein